MSDLAAIRERPCEKFRSPGSCADVDMASPSWEPCFPCQVRAHIDALTEKVNKLPQAFGTVNEPREWPDVVWRSAVLDILEGKDAGKP